MGIPRDLFWILWEGLAAFQSLWCTCIGSYSSGVLIPKCVKLYTLDMSMSVTPDHLWECRYSGTVCNSALSSSHISYHGLQSLIIIISFVMACICSALAFMSWMSNSECPEWLMFHPQLRQQRILALISGHSHTLTMQLCLQGIWFLSALHDFDMTTVHNLMCITRSWRTTSCALTCLLFVLFQADDHAHPHYLHGLSRSMAQLWKGPLHVTIFSFLWMSYSPLTLVLDPFTLTNKVNLIF